MYFLHFQLIIGSLLVATLVQAVSHSPQNPRADVITCLTTHKVPFVVKTSSNWTHYAKPFNLRLVHQPAVITIPETTEQVSSSVTCAAATKLKIQTKGNEHSYTSHSSGGQDGSLIVDMEKFAAVEVNQTTFIAKIGAGQRLGNVAAKIYNQGKRGLPHGTCSGVGIAGHALHGGYGYASRKWGITLDTIVGLDVVLANGTQVHTTAESYPDLFYAMKGAGESFGIVTYLYLQTQSAPSSVLFFSAGLAASLKNLDTVTSGFQRLQSLSLTSPLITPNIAFGMYTDNGGIFSLSGWCMDCNAAVFSKTVLPAMLAGFPGSIPTIQTQGWMEALANLAAPHSMEQPLGHEYAIYDNFYAKSLSYIIANQGKGPFYSIIDLYGGPGSAINTPAPDSSAYLDRDALWVFQNYRYTANNQPPFDPAVIQLVDGLNTANENAQPDGKFTRYLNYVDAALNAVPAAEEYYGAETYNKLLRIKMELDPKFVFWNPQAIGNSMALPM